MTEEILGEYVDSMKAGTGTKQIILDLAYFLTACTTSECLHSSKEIPFYLHSYGIFSFQVVKIPLLPLSKICANMCKMHSLIRKKSCYIISSVV